MSSKSFVQLLLVTTALPASAQFVAFNNLANGPGTASNTTAYSLTAPTSGVLKNITNGANTAVTVTVTGSGTVNSTSSDNPDPGTPAYNVFSSYADFAGTPVPALEVAGAAVLTYSFSGLNPALEYNLQGTGIRGNTAYTDRWALFELVGALSMTSKHTSGTLTHSSVPAIATNQAAVNTGWNNSGDLAWWEHIRPSAAGTFQVTSKQYTGTVPGGSSAGTKGYAMACFRLEQGGVYSGPTNVPIPVVTTNTAPNSINGIKTVFIILMENHNWDTIRITNSCPYINSTLLPMSSFCSQYYNPPGNHPSEPNYIWLVAGTAFGISNDSAPSVNHLSSTNNLFTQMDRAGISWKTYQEDITGTVVPDVNSGEYAVRHNPFVFFDSVRTNLNYCTNHVRPYTELGRDLTNNTVARYNFITPNVTNDMHDASCTGCSTRPQGDTWLAREVPKVLNSAAYTNGGVLFITWDEGNGSTADGPIGMIVLSPRAKGGGYTNSVYYDHSSTVRTIQNIFGLRPYLGGAASATDLGDLFKTVRITSTRWLTNAVRVTATNLIVGRTNYFQYSTNLATTNWTTIRTNVAASTGLTVTNSGLSGLPRRFYRILELP